VIRFLNSTSIQDERVTVKLNEIPINYPALKEELLKLELRYGLARDFYSKGYPNLERGKDVRLTIFAKCINVIATTSFGVQFMIDNMLKDDWWNKTQPWSDRLRFDVTYNEMISIREYDYFLRAGFVILNFSAIEASFRDLIRTLAQKECNGGAGDFRCVYEKLFEKLAVDSEYKKLFELFSLTRNTLHNNGVYYNRWNPNRETTILYKGTQYLFKPKKVVRFTSWEFFLMVMRDCLDVLVHVVNHKDVVCEKFIPDSVGQDSPIPSPKTK
jgi:hypothetical protein